MKKRLAATITGLLLIIGLAFIPSTPASANAPLGGEVGNIKGASLYVWCKNGTRHIIYQGDWGLDVCGTVWYFMPRYDNRCVVDSNRYPEVGIHDTKYPVYLGHTIRVYARDYCHTTVRYDPAP